MMNQGVESLDATPAVFPGPPEGGTCARCGIEYPSIAKGSAETLCGRCQDIADEAASIIAARDRIVALELRDAGLQERERRADLGRIPESLRRRIPILQLRSMLAGQTPHHGFGLSGTAGVGKSMAMAAIVAEMGRKRVEYLARTGAFRKIRGWLTWLPWKETSEQLRTWSTAEGGLVRANDLVDRCGSVEILILDDLGAERIKGSYLEDWATSQLDRILDLRDRSCLALWYTTNLDAAGLQDRYGSRFWSRLSGMATHVELPPAPDLRLVRTGT